MSILGIDHVAIAVEDLEDAIDTYRDLLEEQPHRETVESQGVEIAAFTLGENRVELLEPLDETSNLHRFLEKNGEGIHHLALRTDDVEGELKRAQDLEITCIDPTPRPGAQGYSIGFLHPSDLNGTLLEMAQPPPA